MVDNKENISKQFTKRGVKMSNITQLASILLIVIFLNIIGAYFFTRIDLTSEKRYTLSKTTKKLLKNLDDIVYFKVYLDGDFPAGFKRLKNETREMLNQFRAYNKNIEYEFVDPSAGDDKKQIHDQYKILVNKGLQPTSLQSKSSDGSKQQIIFPGAIVTYKEREIPMQLLNTQIGVQAENVLNSSIQNLEYNIASTIKKLTTIVKPKIAFIYGQGELNYLETEDILTSLSEYYSVERVKIDHKLKALDDFKAIIIAGPDSAFDDKDKFIIDQFIMKGGKSIWLVDPVFASMDSLRVSDATVGIAQNLNLSDQLFTYGVRINYDLIQDICALPIPVKTGNVGNQPQLNYLPWYFFPLVTPEIQHPIVNNLNAVKFEFTSSIDTVGSSAIKKTILLSTSKYSRKLTTPVNISLDIMYKDPDERLFKDHHIPVAVLLEGVFPSPFAGRMDPIFTSDSSFKEIHFKEKSVPNKMIVISDGDLIKNQVQMYNGAPYALPLGYDRYTRETYGNKDFILNCIDYLCDETGLIDVRTRELKLRLLDKTKITKDKFMLQIENVALPVIIIIVFGIIHGLYRRRKYSR